MAVLVNSNALFSMIYIYYLMPLAKKKTNITKSSMTVCTNLVFLLVDKNELSASFTMQKLQLYHLKYMLPRKELHIYGIIKQN